MNDVPRTDTRRSFRSAFTLIELLVVISIIALLIGILLPALGSARQTAQSAACLSNHRQVGIGMASYASESKDHMPGPNTSGAKLTELDAGYVFRDQSSEPTQNFDWVSPILGRSLALPEDRSERVDAIFNEQFRCPSNDSTYDSVFDAGALNVDVGSPIASYSINSNMVVRWDDNDNDAEIYQYSWVEAAVQADGARYRFDQIVNPSGKVISLDGSRYYDQTNGEISFNGSVKQIGGGNWGVIGPGLSNLVSNGEPYKYTTDAQKAAAEAHAYRHNGVTLNASYLDGHANALSEPDSRENSLWFPTGSIVKNAGATNDPDDAFNDVIQ